MSALIDNKRQLDDARRRYDINIELGDIHTGPTALSPTYQSQEAPSAGYAGGFDTIPLTSRSKRSKQSWYNCLEEVSGPDENFSRKRGCRLSYAVVFITLLIFTVACYHIVMNCLFRIPDLTYYH